MRFKNSFSDWRVLFLLIFLTAAFWLPLCRAQNSSASDDHLAEVFSQAQAAQQRGDYRTAANCYEEIVKLRPDVAEAWANLGLMHQFLQKYAIANHAFEVALRKNPRLYVPNLFLGINSLQARQPAAALRYLKVAESLNPKDEQASLNLARAYTALHDDSATIHWYSRATELSPSDPDAWYGLAMAYLGIQDSAVLELGKLGPEQVQARTLVADAFVVQGRTDDAIRIYTKFLASPGRPPCLGAALGFAYIQKGSELAAATFAGELKQEPGCLSAHIGLARLALATGDYGAALAEIQTAWRFDQNFVRVDAWQIWKGLEPDKISSAGTWLKQNDSSSEGLVPFLLQSVESGGMASAVPRLPTPVIPHDADAHLTPEELWMKGRYALCAAALTTNKSGLSPARTLLLSQCSYYSGNYQASLDASQAALRMAPHSPNALYWKAKASQELATKALERMNQAAPGSPRVHLLMADLHRAREEYNAAEAEYLQVINSGSNDPAARLGLAQVYYQQSQDDNALEQLQPVLQADPANPQASFVMGQILVRRRQFAAAMPYLKTGLNGSPLSVPEAHALLAKCYVSLGNYPDALTEIKSAVPADKNGMYHYQLYQIYQKLGDTKSAAVALQESETLRRQGDEPSGKN